MSHSPGPWAVIRPKNAKGQEQPPRIVQLSKYGQPTSGLVATLGFPHTGNRDHNAKLISHAPDMLEALEEIATRLWQQVEPKTATAQEKRCHKIAKAILHKLKSAERKPEFANTSASFCMGGES